MRGPTLHSRLKSKQTQNAHLHWISIDREAIRQDWKSVDPKEIRQSAMDDFFREIVSCEDSMAVRVGLITRKEDHWDRLKEACGTIALYLARFARTKNPFWVDEAILICGDYRLPIIETLRNAHIQVTEMRRKNPKHSYFRVGRTKYVDMAFYRMAAHVLGGATVRAAAKEAARWLDMQKEPGVWAKASTFEKGFAAWKEETPWWPLLQETIEELSPEERKGFIDSTINKLSSLPPLREELHGSRR